MSFTGLSLDQAPAKEIPLRYFLTAPWFLLIMGFLFLLKGQSLFASEWNFETISLVHLYTLGWLTMIMFGAVYQMIPVLIGGKIPIPWLAKPVHFLLATGALLMTGGLYWKYNLLLQISAFFLLLATTIFAWQKTTALLRMKSKTPSALGMIISVFSFWIILGLGFYLLLSLSAIIPPLDNRIVLRKIHFLIAMEGWVGALILGISFHVIPMFYLAPEFPKKKAHIILGTIAGNLLFISFSPFISIFQNYLDEAIILTEIAFSFYAFLMLQSLAHRKRKKQDSSLKAFSFALRILIILPLLHTASLLFHINISMQMIALFLGVFSLGITGGMLLKIVPFLVWLHRFSKLIGQPNVPTIRDILPEKQSKIWFRLYLSFCLFFIPAQLFLPFQGRIFSQLSELFVRASGLSLILLATWSLVIFTKAIRIQS